MARDRRWIALAMAVMVAACGGDSNEKAEQEAAAKFAAQRARTDSIRKARQAAPAPATVATATPAASLSPAQQALASADSVRKAKAQDDAEAAQSSQSRAATLAAKGNGQAAADSARPESDVLREAYAYGGGTRDPFQSLVKSKNAGPELSDLQLVGVYQDVRSAANSVAIVRDKKDGKRFKLRTGDQVGRLRVAQIRPKDVVFTIEDFGFERQETLSLRKQEDVTP